MAFGFVGHETGADPRPSPKQPEGRKPQKARTGRGERAAVGMAVSPQFGKDCSQGGCLPGWRKPFPNCREEESRNILRSHLKVHGPCRGIVDSCRIHVHLAECVLGGNLGER